jgi:hypothetical protein
MRPLQNAVSVRVTAPLLGDTLCSFPALEEYSKTVKVSVDFVNPAVIELLPKDSKLWLTNKNQIDIELDINSIFARSVSHEHMIQGYFRALSLEVPSFVPTINIDASEIVKEQYDFLISPYSHSDISGNKLWPLDRWQHIVNHLSGIGSVGVFGSKKGSYTIPCEFDNATMIIDRSLSEVAALIKKARLILTIDNGISHLTGAVGTEHLLLYPACLPLTWVRNPRDNCHVIQDTPNLINANRVLKTIDSIVGN